MKTALIARRRRRGGNPLAAYAAGGVLPLAVADFVASKYFDPDATTLDALLSPARSGLAAMVDSSGNTVWTRHNLWRNSAMTGGVSGSPGTAPTGLSQTVIGTPAVTYGAGTLQIVADTERFFFAPAIAAGAYQTLAFEVDIVCASASGNWKQYVKWQSPPAGATVTYYKDGVQITETDLMETGSFHLKVVMAVAGTGGSIQARIGAGIDSNSIADITFSNINIYEDSLAMAEEGTLGTYVETTGEAVYGARVPHYVEVPELYWIGDSFLNGDVLPDDLSALIDSYARVGYVSDGAGGSTLAEQLTRLTSDIGSDPTIADRTLIIMDGGLTDSAANAISSIQGMAALLNHDRWLYVQSTPFSANNGDGVQEKWAAIEAAIGSEHWVNTYEEAQAESDGSPEDIAELALELWPLSLKISDSDQHPNAAGYDLLASLVYAKLVGNGWLGTNLVESGGALFTPATENLLTNTVFDGALPTGWSQLIASGTRTLTTLYGVPAIRFQATSERPVIYQGITLSASTQYTASMRVVSVDGSVPTGNILSAKNFTSATGDLGGAWADRDEDGYISITFTTDADGAGHIYFGPGADGGANADIIVSEVQLVEGDTRLPWVPTFGTAVTAAADDPNFTLEAATYDVRVIADGVTTDLDGEVHGGGDYWPAEAVGVVSQVVVYPDGTF